MLRPRFLTCLSLIDQKKTFSGLLLLLGSPRVAPRPLARGRPREARLRPRPQAPSPGGGGEALVHARGGAVRGGRARGGAGGVPGRDGGGVGGEGGGGGRSLLFFPFFFRGALADAPERQGCPGGEGPRGRPRRGALRRRGGFDDGDGDGKGSDSDVLTFSLPSSSFASSVPSPASARPDGPGPLLGAVGRGALLGGERRATLRRQGGRAGGSAGVCRGRGGGRPGLPARGVPAGAVPRRGARGSGSGGRG